MIKRRNLIHNSDGDAIFAMNFLPAAALGQTELARAAESKVIRAVLQHGSCLNAHGMPTGYTMEVRDDMPAYSLLGPTKDLFLSTAAYVTRVRNFNGQVYRLQKRYTDMTETESVREGVTLDGVAADEGFHNLADLFISPTEWVALYENSEYPPLLRDIRLHELRIVDFGRSEDLTRDVMQCSIIMNRWSSKFPRNGHVKANPNDYLPEEFWLPSLHAANPDDNAAGSMPHLSVHFLGDERAENLHWVENINEMQAPDLFSLTNGQSYSRPHDEVGDTEYANLLVTVSASPELFDYQLHTYFSSHAGDSIQQVVEQLPHDMINNAKKLSLNNLDGIVRIAVAWICERLRESQQHPDSGAQLITRVMSSCCNNILKYDNRSPTGSAPSSSKSSPASSPSSASSSSSSAAIDFTPRRRSSQQQQQSSSLDSDNQLSTQLQDIINNEVQSDQDDAYYRAAARAESFMFNQNTANFRDIENGVLYANNHGPYLIAQSTLDWMHLGTIDSAAVSDFRKGLRTNPHASQIRDIRILNQVQPLAGVPRYKHCAMPFMSPLVDEEDGANLRHELRWLCDPGYKQPARLADSGQWLQNQLIALTHIVLSTCRNSANSLRSLFVVSNQWRCMHYGGSRRWAIYTPSWLRLMYETVHGKYSPGDNTHTYKSIYTHLNNNIRLSAVRRDKGAVKRGLAGLEVQMCFGDMSRYVKTHAMITTGVMTPVLLLEGDARFENGGGGKHHPWRDTTCSVATPTRLCTRFDAFLQLYSPNKMQNISEWLHNPATRAASGYLRDLNHLLVCMWDGESFRQKLAQGDQQQQLKQLSQDYSTLYSFFGDDRFFVYSSMLIQSPVEALETARRLFRMEEQAVRELAGIASSSPSSLDSPADFIKHLQQPPLILGSPLPVAQR